jgi:hypothetical protein
MAPITASAGALTRAAALGYRVVRIEALLVVSDIERVLAGNVAVTRLPPAL